MSNGGFEMAECEDFIRAGREATLYACDHGDVFELTCAVDEFQIFISRFYHGLCVWIVGRFRHVIGRDFGLVLIQRFENTKTAVMGQLGRYHIGEEVVEIG